MPAVVENGNGPIDIVFQIGTDQLAQTHTLATHIAAIGHAGVEEAKQTMVGIIHLTDEKTLVAFGVGVEPFGTRGHIVAPEKTMHDFAAVSGIVERRFENLTEGFGIHCRVYLKVSLKMMSAVV